MVGITRAFGYKSVSYSILALFLCLQGCATASYLPALGNVKTFSNVECLYSRHTPGGVAELEQYIKAIATLKNVIPKDTSIVDKLMPSNSMVDSLGKNAAPLGLATANVVGAVTDNISMASIIGSIITQGLESLTEARSEDKTQARVDFCTSKDSKFVYFKDDKVTVIQSRLNDQDTSSIVKAINGN